MTFIYHICIIKTCFVQAFVHADKYNWRFDLCTEGVQVHRALAGALVSDSPDYSRVKYIYCPLDLQGVDLFKEQTGIMKNLHKL